MAFSGRHSQVSAAPSTARTSALELTPLPTYQPLRSPLNTKAVETLAGLHMKYGFQQLEKDLDSSLERLAASVGEINDRLVERQTEHQKHKRRRIQTRPAPSSQGDVEPSQDAGGEAQQEEDAQMQWTRDNVEKMTGRMETQVRKAIDSQEGVVSLGRALRAVQDVAAGAQPSQHTQTQRSARVTQPGSTSDETRDGPSQAAARSLSSVLDGTLEQAQGQYEAKSMRARYSKHKHYVGFKKVLHDAQHSGDENPPPVQADRYWFAVEEGGSPPPGNTGRDGDDDDDDDVAIARVTISTVCPITLKTFEDPVTSTKCPHSFEKTAIMSMVRARPAGRRGAAPPARQDVQCPVSGCDQRLTVDDLKEDPVLVRQVSRILRRKELQAQRGDGGGDDDDEETDGRRHIVEEIEDDDDDDDDDVDRLARDAADRQATQIKRERITQNDEIEDEEMDDGSGEETSDGSGEETSDEAEEEAEED